jgi:hypothetical protein
MKIQIKNVDPNVQYTHWVTGKVYAIGDVVYDNGVSPTYKYYRASVGHTSTTSLTTDIANWTLITDTNFEVHVYDNADFVNPVEVHRVSKTVGRTDGFNVPLFIEDVINTNSKYIRCRSNSLITIGMDTVKAAVAFSGGTDGSAVADSHVNAGWADFLDTEAYPVRVLINGGYSTPTVQQYMGSLCAARLDCVAILDVPTASQAAAAAVTYRVNTLNLNSSSCALWCTCS